MSSVTVLLDDKKIELVFESETKTVSCVKARIGGILGRYVVVTDPKSKKNPRR
jgi:hypothetical protein